MEVIERSHRPTRPSDSEALLQADRIDRPNLTDRLSLTDQPHPTCDRLNQPLHFQSGVQLDERSNDPAQ